MKWFRCNSREPIFNASSHVLQLQVAGRSVTVPVPTSIEKFDPTSNQAAPDSPSPRLEWAYGRSSPHLLYTFTKVQSLGYRGKDVRNNIHCLPTGELLYFCGSIVVLHNVEEHTQRHYTGHTCDIRRWGLHFLSLRSKEGACVAKIVFGLMRFSPYITAF